MLVAALVVMIAGQTPPPLMDEATRKRASADWETCVNVKEGDNYERAIVACDNLLLGRAARELDEPNRGIVIAKRGVMRARLHQWQQALDDLNRAFPMVKEDFKMWVRLERGAALQERKDYRAAHPDLNAVVVYEPTSSEYYWRALVLRGINFFLTGDYARAIGDFDSLIRTEHGDLAHIYYLRSLSRNQMQNFSGADSDMAEAIRRDKNIDARMKGYGHKLPAPKRRPG